MHVCQLLSFCESFSKKDEVLGLLDYYDDRIWIYLPSYDERKNHFDLIQSDGDTLHDYSDKGSGVSSCEGIFISMHLIWYVLEKRQRH